MLPAAKVRMIGAVKVKIAKMTIAAAIILQMTRPQCRPSVVNLAIEVVNVFLELDEGSSIRLQSTVFFQAFLQRYGEVNGDTFEEPRIPESLAEQIQETWQALKLTPACLQGQDLTYETSQVT